MNSATSDATPSLRAPAWATLLTLLALAAWEAAGWDMALSRRVADGAGFALRHAWWTEQLLHNGGRILSGLFLALLVWDAWRPLVPGPTRRERVYWLATSVGILLLVPAFKRLSRTSCPWDLAPFGGQVPYVPHWLLGVADGGAGRCFPSGHAVAAFAFIGLFFLWRRHRPRGARIFLAVLLALGAVFGAAQLLRGAHFASHTLWSAWLCWALALLAARLEPAAHRLQDVQARRPAEVGDGVLGAPGHGDTLEQRR